VRGAILVTSEASVRWGMAFDWDIDRDLQPYIETHLVYELKYLLVAAGTWSVVHAERDRAAWPDHLVVMAMESAFVHTRTLCEFLALEEGWAKGRSPHHAPALPLWNEYCAPMHMKLLHPDPRRSYAPGEQKGDDLKDRVVDLAHEVLAGWDQVADQEGMAAFRISMVRARDSAVADCQQAARRMKALPLSGSRCTRARVPRSGQAAPSETEYPTRLCPAQIIRSSRSIGDSP
jgi:hypothetical protein